MFKLVGPFNWGYTDRVFRFFGAGATELHLPLLISTSLFKRIWLSLLIVRFFSFVRKSFVFFLSSLFRFSWAVMTYASLTACEDLPILYIFFACASISLEYESSVIRSMDTKIRLNRSKVWAEGVDLLSSQELEGLTPLDVCRSLHFFKFNFNILYYQVWFY